MSRIWFFLAVLTLPLCALAQLDSVPYFPQTPAKPFEVGPPKSKFNRKDAVMMVMRQTNIYNQFKNPYDPSLVAHFQFADVNSDGFPDAVYPGTGELQRTFIAVMKDMQYVLIFDEPGAIADWDSIGSIVHLTLREDAQAPERYLQHLRRYALDKKSNKSQMLWQMAWFGNQLPQQTFETPLVRQVSVAGRVRHSAELKNEPVVDYNADKKPDGTGNILAVLPPATRIRALSATKNGADDFIFVIAPAKGLPPGHVLYGIEGKPAWVAGWVLASELSDL
jgi:hypothetical protein